MPANRFFDCPTCVYCHGVADTKDHAPPRCLLKKPIGNETKVITFDACKRCNLLFSDDENIFKAILAHVSFEPDLIAETKPGGPVHRAMKRDKKLRALIDAALQPNGYFQVGPNILVPMRRVVTKIVQGLYFGIYGRVVSREDVAVITLEHARQTSSEALLSSLRRSSTPDLSAGAWPEVSPNPRRLTKAAILWPGGTEHDLMKPAEWIDVQPDAFCFTFVRGEEGRAICIMEIRRTILAAATCPWPDDRGPIRKGRAQKYSRERDKK